MSKINNNLKSPDKKENTTMELNRLSVSIISVLITLSIALGTFCYQIGIYNNETRNIKEQQVILREDLKNEIYKLEEKKADKIVLEMMIKRLDESIKSNTEQYNALNRKLDNLIDNKLENK